MTDNSAYREAKRERERQAIEHGSGPLVWWHLSGEQPDVIAPHAVNHSNLGSDVIVFRHESTDIMPWRCHYCGSLMPSNFLKCSSCGGEKR